jgi:hypothetical protein
VAVEHLIETLVADQHGELVAEDPEFLLEDLVQLLAGRAHFCPTNDQEPDHRCGNRALDLLLLV